ncbi:hypothetical protein A6456_38220 [Paraburkholderia tropica]|nr:hypothetical protein [Paraburkholderia tropica]OBR47920.1 hypothetical protein A6456_38220 [Paraburkholderia tropica]
MNWRRLYATAQIWLTVGSLALGSAILYSVIVVGVCRKILAVSESIAVYWIGLPLLIALFIWFVLILPKHLRKAGMLSDSPERFGPWFKK